MKDYFLGDGSFKPRLSDYRVRFGCDAEAVFNSDLKTYNARHNFFTERQKQLAIDIPAKKLRKMYEKSEQELKKVARKGNEYELAKVMKVHGDCEYAMLYQQTPEFQTKIKQRELCL